MVTPFQETKDNIGSADETRSLVLIGPFYENFQVEEGPTVVKSQDMGSSFLLGVVTSAVLGVSRLGAEGVGVLTVRRVVNPNNTFHEHFRYDGFNDSANTTGTFDTTNHLVNLDLNEVFQTLSIFLNEQSPQSIQVSVDLLGGDAEFIVDNKGGHRLTINEGS